MDQISRPSNSPFLGATIFGAQAAQQARDKSLEENATTVNAPSSDLPNLKEGEENPQTHRKIRKSLFEVLTRSRGSEEVPKKWTQEYSLIW